MFFFFVLEMPSSVYVKRTATYLISCLEFAFLDDAIAELDFEGELKGLREHHCSIAIINDKLVLSLTVTGSTDNKIVMRTFVQHRRDRKLARSLN